MHVLEPYINHDMLQPLANAKFLQMCQHRPSKNLLLNFVSQHYHYSRHFTRFLCAVLSVLDDDQSFQDLMPNLLEEMGLTESHPTPHIKLYEQMIEALGLEPSEPCPPTQALINTMYHFVRSTNPVHAVSAICLGAESLVSYIYTIIYNGLLAVGYQKEQLKFLSVHMECDDDHAKILKQILDRITQNQPPQILLAQSVAHQLIAARVCFLEDCI